MVFNFKKTFTLGSKTKVRNDEKETVVCLHYIRNVEFDTNYIISSSEKSNEVQINRINNDIKWNDVFEDITVNKEKQLETLSVEQSTESIPNIKSNNETQSSKPKSILKKAVSTDTIPPSENETKPAIKFLATKDYDGPSEEFAQKKLQVTQDETRTERRDTKAIVALKKARAKEEKEKLKKALEIEAAQSDEVPEENNDVTYKTRMSMLYSSQASSIFFAEDEPEAEAKNEPEAEAEDESKIVTIETPKEEIENTLEIGNGDYETMEQVQPSKKKMADVKKNKQSVKNIKMQEGDDASVGSNTSA